MEIIGIGTEIVECLRVARMIEEHGELFLRRIYSDHEIRDCQSRKRATEHFAARWAGKEAVLKALNRPWRRTLVWTDIEIHRDANEIWSVELTGQALELAREAGVSQLFISLAHCRAYATAYVLAVHGAGALPGP
jgi:holo-[acyl-carrier protein] synthase